MHVLPQMRTGLELMRLLLGGFNVEDPRKMDTEAVATAKGWYGSDGSRRWSGSSTSTNADRSFLKHLLKTNMWQSYAMQYLHLIPISQQRERQFAVGTGGFGWVNIAVG